MSNQQPSLTEIQEMLKNGIVVKFSGNIGLGKTQVINIICKALVNEGMNTNF